MVLGKKATSKALFYYLLGCGVLCLLLALVAIVGVIVWIAVMGPALFVDGPYVSVIVGLFIAAMTFGGVWFTIRFSNWKKAPENLVYINEENNLVIYTKKGEVTINKDDIDSIYGIPESLFIKYFVRDYGELHVHTTDKKYKVQFVEGVTSLPNNIFNALGLQFA
jgi:hypothetical protein